MINIQDTEGLADSDKTDIIVAQIVELRGTDNRFDRANHFILKEFIYGQVSEDTRD